MRKTKCLLTAVAWGGLSLSGLAFADESPARTPDQPAGADATQGGTVSGNDSLSRDADPAGAATPQGLGDASDRSLTDVRKVLAQVADAAVSEDGVARLTALLSIEDQKRLGAGNSDDKQIDQAGGGGDAAALRDKVRQFRQDWKEKYGSDFGVQNQELVFSGVRLDTVGGRTGVGADAASADAGAGTSDDRNQAQPAGARTRRSAKGDAGLENAPARDAATFEKRVGEANRDDARAGRGGSPDAKTSERSKDGDAEEPLTDKGPARAGDRRDATARGDEADAGGSSTRTGVSRALAGHDAQSGAARPKSIAVIIPPPRGAQDAHLRLVQESGGGWRIDLPDSLDRRQLLAGLGDHLEAIQREKQNWPDNADDAARLVSQHILTALTESGHAGGAAAPQTTR